MIQRCPLALLLAILFLTDVGCSSLTKSRTTFKAATPQNPAVKCLCLWQQAEGTTSDGKTCRGFAGQVFFMPAQGEVPVIVHGAVKIFAFDNIGEPQTQSRPITQLEFTDDEWQSTVTDTQFGPAYNVFVPYPREGHYEADCALRLRLIRPDGTELFSDMASVKLNGVSRKSPTNSSPKVATLNQPTETRNAQTQELRSETIGIERDGQMLPNPNRVRRIQIGPLHDYNSSAQDELDAKLDRLRIANEVHEINAQQ